MPVTIDRIQSKNKIGFKVTDLEMDISRARTNILIPVTIDRIQSKSNIGFKVTDQEEAISRAR